MITLYRWASVLGAPLMMGVGQTEAALTIRVEMKAKREAGKLGTIIKDVMPKWQDMKTEELNSERHREGLRGDLSSN